MRFLMFVFLSAGVLLLGLGALNLVREEVFLQQAQTVTATVVELDSSEGGSGNICPLMEFASPDGEPIRLRANACKKPARYNIGDKVDLLFVPPHLDKVQMPNFLSEFGGAVGTAAAGFLFLLIGLYLVLLQKRAAGSEY